ncbi:putrescine/spermidine ABC transporter ATPase protein [Escherichia coli SHECO001]|nr:putrescine/spermidine ABC transporter ATPase protein [Escherichia coli SHECO001]
MGQSKKLNKQPSSLSPLVQLAGIRKCFDGKEVIPQLDLTINNGEFLTLLGPSGCGKTTEKKNANALMVKRSFPSWI